jgi:tRNA(adenine34) deaminase
MKNEVSRRSILVGGTAIALALQSSEAATAKHVKDYNNPAFKLDHEKFMRLAVQQANKLPECPFGSIVVDARTQKVVSEGWVEVGKNPIWHGEMSAINKCPDVRSGFDWTQACLYTTGESCPMCQAAIVWTKMPLVVYGSSMPFLQKCGFGQINIRAQKIIDAAIFDYGDCEIIGGVLEKECNELFVKARELTRQ